MKDSQFLTLLKKKTMSELEIWEDQVSEIDKAIRKSLTEVGLINPLPAQETEENKNESL